MKEYTELEKHLIQLADFLGNHYGPSTEIVVHDFKNDINHSIIYIVHGEVSGRSVGDGPTPTFLRELSSSRKGTVAGKIRQLSYTSDGRILRSSAIDYFDDEDKIINALCLNQDITKTMNLQNAFSDFAAIELFESSQINNEPAEPTTISIQELMDNLIHEGIAKIGLYPEQMNKTAKLQLIKHLDDKGVFAIQKSGKIVCDLLNISKFTLYNYLDEVRK